MYCDTCLILLFVLGVRKTDSIKFHPRTCLSRTSQITVQKAEKGESNCWQTTLPYSTNILLQEGG